MSDIFPKKNVYHSTLRSASPVTVLITSEPTQSKFKGKGYFIDFKHEGEDHQYTIENDTIREDLTGFKGHMVELIAEGTKDEATLQIKDLAKPGSQAANTSRAQQPTPPAANGDAGHRAPPPPPDLKHAKLALCQHVNARLMALEAARVCKETWEARHPTLTMPSDQFFALATSLYISIDRQGLTSAMPYEIIAAKTPTAAPTPQEPAPKPRKPAPPPEPPPAPAAPEPDDDEIPW